MTDDSGFAFMVKIYGPYATSSQDRIIFLNREKALAYASHLEKKYPYQEIEIDKIQLIK